MDYFYVRAVTQNLQYKREWKWNPNLNTEITIHFQKYYVARHYWEHRSVALSSPLDHRNIPISKGWACRVSVSKQCGCKCLTQHLYDVCLRTNNRAERTYFLFQPYLTIILAPSSCCFLQQPLTLSEFQNKSVCLGMCVYFYIYLLWQSVPSPCLHELCLLIEGGSEKHLVWLLKCGLIWILTSPLCSRQVIINAGKPWI